MKAKKKTKKRKDAALVVSIPEEEEFLSSFLKASKDGAPSDLVAGVPNERLAQLVIERLPLDDESSLPLLFALKERFKEKPVQKAIKRTLFRVRKRGVSAGVFDAAETASTPVLKALQRERPVALLGPLDPMGFRAVLISLPRAVQGVDAGVGLVSNEHGIRQFLFENFSKKRIKELETQLSEEAGPLVDTSLSHAATVIEEAYRRQRQLHSDGPAEYLEMRPRLLAEVSLLDRAAIYDVIPEPSETGGVLTNSQLAELFQHPLLTSWLIEFDRLRPYMEDILKIEDSPIILTEAQKFDRVSQIKLKCMQELFPAPGRALLKGRFEEMAYVFWKMGEKEPCRLSLAAARSLEEEQTMLMRNPVPAFFLERSLGLYMHAMQDQAESETPPQDKGSRLIIP